MNPARSICLAGDMNVRPSVLSQCVRACVGPEVHCVRDRGDKSIHRHSYAHTDTLCDPSLSCMRSENFGFGIVSPRVAVNGVCVCLCVLWLV